MDNPGYTTLTRQSGLLSEMQVLAHNIANLSTTGFRREGVLFSEYVRQLDRQEEPLSMAAARAHQTYLTQGTLTQTGGTLDLAIEGEGFFLVETPQGERLTRAGHFSTDAAGEMVNPDGHRLLDIGGSPVFVPAGAAQIAIARDGTVSADGQPLAQIGLMRPEDPSQLRRAAGTLHEATGPLVPVDEPVLLQGFLEDSNVNPISEMARLIEVQRA
ncbi:MAG: flagellar hook-basal body complex protein, partial [Rhodobacteraceae bacterium]|nr:flagellar hook-basal body complex protein [Paracoccaceae bacterium]